MNLARGGRGKRRGITPVELVVAVLVLTVLTAAALPMYYRYAGRAAVSTVRGDLRAFNSSVEAYYTEHRDVPARAEDAVAGWTSGYAGRYGYTRRGVHSYEFSTRGKVEGVYLYIDERGTVGEKGGN